MAVSAPNWDRFLPPFSADSPQIPQGVFGGQTICITGAGGSIGSALAKALSSEPLEALVLLEASERGLFEVQQYMRATRRCAPCTFILGSVNDRRLLTEVFTRFRPRFVFHAAAFKHVELLESNPFAAIENNVLGTYTLARSALEHGVARFVLISTDKAVHPHSVMGASKRVAELVALSLSCPSFRASAIRLGNVIGSAGSVVPIFLDHIASKRAVPVTDPNASRYFLTLDQTVAAILQTGAAGCDGSILIPELSAPVLINDLAQFLIRTMSRGESLPVTFTGLRPGEKLTEETIGRDEQQIGDFQNSLAVVRTRRPLVEESGAAMKRFGSYLADRNYSELLSFLQRLVPGYVPSKLAETGTKPLAKGVR